MPHEDPNYRSNAGTEPAASRGSKKRSQPLREGESIARPEQGRNLGGEDALPDINANNEHEWRAPSSLPSEIDESESMKSIPDKIIDVKKVKKANHTDMFDEKFLIVRRGFYIDFLVDLDRVAFVKVKNARAKDDNDRKSNKAVTEVCLEKDDKDENVAGFKLDTEGKRVKIPATCIVGEWKLFVNEEPPFRVVILFNPWCEEDPCYMEDKDGVQKYIKDESGKIYRGEKRYNWWTYGQFETGILDAVLDLLNKAKGLSPAAKASPVNVSRALSAIVNCNDDDGLIYGCWDPEQYGGGKRPSHWTGSVEIFRLYFKKNRAVRYGQCWVFAGCLTTALRCLGIPSRSVTCKGSLHDDNGNLVSDIKYEYDDGERKRQEHEKMWNFHVWNEAWFKRPDLGDKYGGWQAVDATPQEDSGSLKQCGPASVNAIKEGKCYMPYDAGFLFAEVNADCAMWCKKKMEIKYKLKKVYNHPKKIGKAVMTDVAGDASDNVTGNYKYKEGSAEERKQTFMAVSCGTRPSIYDEVKNKDQVEIKSDLPEEFRMSKDLKYQFFIKSLDDHDENCEAHLIVTCNLVTYHGKILREIMHDSRKISIPRDSPYQGVIKREQVLKDLQDNNTLVFTVFCHIEKKNDMTAEKFTVELDANEPELEVVSKGPYKKGQTLDLRIKYYNELDIELTKGVFKVDAPYMRRKKEFPLRNPVPPKDSCYIRFQYTPRSDGEIRIVGSFICEELPVRNTEIEIEVEGGGGNDEGSRNPSREPSQEPSRKPSQEPSRKPSQEPSRKPS